MKKKILLCLISTVLLCCGCGDSATPSKSTPIADTSEIKVADQSNVLLNCTVMTDDVMSGDGANVLGTYAYISIDKNTLKSVSEEDFSAFCDYVSTCSYNWFSIICEDNTGIVFSGCDINMPSYGKVDSDCSLLDTYGFISKDSNSKYTYSASN